MTLVTDEPGTEPPIAEAAGGTSAGTEPSGAEPSDGYVSVVDGPTGDPYAFADEQPGGSVASVVVLWLAAVVLGAFLVLYLVEPFFQQGRQAHLLEEYRSRIEIATYEADTPDGVTVPTKAPSAGTPVGVLEMGRIGVQQAVVEGVSPTETQVGPAHVPGTAGLGQPGNSVVLGRHATFGAPFAAIDALQKGDPVVVTTTQGPTLYRVERVREVRVVLTEPERSTTDDATAAEPATTGGTAEDAPEVVTVDDLYGKTKDDRLTLVTSASSVPWNAGTATVVEAKLEGQPFAPTPQGGRADDHTGLGADPAGWSALLVVLGLVVATAALAVWGFRTFSRPVAYLLAVAPLLGCLIVLAETTSRLLPAWW